MTHQIESSRGKSSRKAYPRSVELTEIEFCSTVWLLGQLLLMLFIWIILQKYDSETQAPVFVRSSEVTDRPWIRIYPEELTLNLGKKEKKRVGFGFWSTDGLPREKKKENYQKDKKGLCFKLSYIFTFKSYWQVMIWKNIENDFWKLRVQKFMFY